MSKDIDEIKSDLLELEEDGNASGFASVKGWFVIAGVSIVLIGFSLVLWSVYTRTPGDNSKGMHVLRPEGPVRVKPKNPGGMDVSDSVTIQDLTLNKGEKIEVIVPEVENPILAGGKQPAKLKNPTMDLSKTPTPTTQGGKVNTPIHGIKQNRSQTQKAPTTGSQKSRAQRVKKVEKPKTRTIEPLKKASVTTSKKKASVTTSKKQNVSVATKSTGAKVWGIQIGSVKSAAGAKSLWGKATKKGITKGLTFHVQKVTVKGRDYFRVQGLGVASHSIAKKVCAGVKRAGFACIPVSKK